jgi:hypothetical protein
MAGAQIFACENCPGLGLDEIKINVEDEMSRKCKEPGCEKKVSRSGYCWTHCKTHGIDPKTGKQIVPPTPVEEPAQEGALADPREAFECPHCHAVLSSLEVERPTCPVCGESLRAHADQDGETMPPAVETDTPVESVETESATLDGRVTNMDGELVEFGVDAVVVMAIRDAMRDLEASWLIDLSGLAPGRAICETYRKLEALQGLRG